MNELQGIERRNGLFGAAIFDFAMAKSKIAAPKPHNPAAEGG